MHSEKLISTDTLYEGTVIKLKLCEVELENGKTVRREIVEHNGGVAVLAIDDADNILLVRQFRLAAGGQIWELPAGKLEKGEEPAACGRRELEEETGYTAADFRFLGRILPTPGYVTEVLHLYLAKGLAATAQRLDADEFLDVAKMPFDKALQMCLDGEITDAKTVVSLMKYALLERAQKH